MATHQDVITQVVVGGLLMVGDWAWSIYEKVGRPYLQARWSQIQTRIEVMTATINAQTDEMRAKGVRPPSAAAIADRIPDTRVTADVVAEVLSNGNAASGTVRQ